MATGEPGSAEPKANGVRVAAVGCADRILLWERGLCVAVIPDFVTTDYLAGASCSTKKTPFLLAVTMSSRPSPFTSATTNWVPMPLWSSISRGVNVVLPSAPRAASNQ